jgi:hypothetical protein
MATRVIDPPEGFVLDTPESSGPPAPPEGFVLDSIQTPPPPEGFTLDTPAPRAAEPKPLPAPQARPEPVARPVPSAENAKDWKPGTFEPVEYVDNKAIPRSQWVGEVAKQHGLSQEEAIQLYRDPEFNWFSVGDMVGKYTPEQREKWTAQLNAAEKDPTNRKSRSELIASIFPVDYATSGPVSHELGKKRAKMDAAAKAKEEIGRAHV